MFYQTIFDFFCCKKYDHLSLIGKTFNNRNVTANSTYEPVWIGDCSQCAVVRNIESVRYRITLIHLAVEVFTKLKLELIWKNVFQRMMMICNLRWDKTMANRKLIKLDMCPLFCCWKNIQLFCVYVVFIFSIEIRILITAKRLRNFNFNKCTHCNVTYLISAHMTPKMYSIHIKTFQILVR